MTIQQMLCTPIEKGMEINYAMPPARWEAERDEFLTRDRESMSHPALRDPARIIRNIRAPEGVDISDLIEKGACSVDIKLSRFTDPEGKRLEFPFQIPYLGTVTGHSDLILSDDEVIYCVETRSKMARKGLAAIGFNGGIIPARIPEGMDDKTVDAFQSLFGMFEDREMRHGRMFSSGVFTLDFILKNFNPNPIVIERPFAPLQITGTGPYQRSPVVRELPFRLTKGDDDVTGANSDIIGSFWAYRVHLCDELLVPKVTGPVSIEDDDIDARYDSIPLKDIQKAKPKFCLTLTDEAIRCNGVPAYMFPFHYLDAKEHHHRFSYSSQYSDFVEMLFLEMQGMPVTGNAGVINPTVDGRIVCENITDGRDLEKYFRHGEPFAFVVPVPYLDGHIHECGKRKAHDLQEKIIL